MCNMANSAGESTSIVKKIQDLQCGQLVTLLGVASTFRPPSRSRSRSKGFSCFLELVDESEKKIKCTIFGPESSLPLRCPVGSIVCLKRVAVEEHQGRQQLSANAKVSYWGILEEKSDGSLGVSASNSCTGVSVCNDFLVTLSVAEEQRGKTLKEWAEQTNLVPGPSTLRAASSFSWLPIDGRVCPPTGARHFSVEVRPINQLTLGMPKTGVCGLVKYYQPPSNSNGRDFYIKVHIVDESSPSTGITCVIFNPLKDKLAIMGRVGAVALIKGVRIETQRDTGNLRLFGHEHTLVGVFSGEVSDVIPNRIGTWYDLTIAEKKRVEDLRLWSRREGPFLLNTKFEEVTPGCHFNTVCQVAAMAVLEEEKTAIISVFDGTTSKMPCREFNVAKSKRKWDIDSIPELYYTYRLLTHDVWITNINQLNVEAGDVIHMINVFSHQHPPRQVSATSTVEPPQVELRLFHHEGSITQLEEDCQDAVKFIESLPVVHGIFPSWRVLEESEFYDESEDIVHTIVNNSTPQATLEEIRKADIGSEFLANVEVKLIRPRGLDDICMPVCPSCGDRGIDDQAENTNSPTCPRDGATLVYKPTFSLLVSDESGELEVLVDSQESQRLFSKTLSNNVAANRESKEKILDVFYALTGGNDPFFALPADPRYSYTRPTFQCAIQKVVDPSTASIGEAESCSYHLVKTIIGHKVT